MHEPILYNMKIHLLAFMYVITYLQVHINETGHVRLHECKASCKNTRILENKTNTRKQYPDIDCILFISNTLLMTP